MRLAIHNNDEVPNMTTQTTDMNVAVGQLIQAIKDDYATWMKLSGSSNTAVKEEMIEEFNEQISYTVGKKYIKVTKGGSVWGFIVNVDDDTKFKKGDLLMAKTYSSPARNKARGNILDGGYKINWTGTKYL